MMTLPVGPGTAHYLDLAVQHLELVDDGTPPEMMRLHCHFALIFLQLGMERQRPTREGNVLTIVERR